MWDLEQNNTSAKPNVLCDTCRGLIIALRARFGESSDIKEPNRAEIYPVLARYLIHEVQASGLRGCHICSLISQAVCSAHSEDSITHVSDSTIIVKPGYIYAPSHDGTLRLDGLQVQLLDSGGERLPGVTLRIISDYNYHSHHPVPASWSFSTGSDASFDLARKWLDHCLSNHTLCEEMRAAPASTNESPFPDFLVDVEPGHPIRLRHCKDLLDRPQYLTLSHRWGNSRIFQLTSENIATLLSEINPLDLPKTFQDAIIITRRLGHRYLWIDSLCIIQDSKEHWEQESTIMGDIYRGTACTIAALGATDGNSGCFKTRNPLCFQLCEVRLSADRIVHLLPPGGLRSALYMTTKRTGYGPQVEPLHERAWVMQEWMLSPRTLHYGTLGLYWECAKHSSNDRVIGIYDVPSLKYSLHQVSSLKITGDRDRSYRTFAKWWNPIISMYTPCGMTYATDRLVAINGMVKFVESRTGLHCLAGLWKEYLFPELLWSVTTEQRRSETYQAPTWSWASLNCEIIPGIPGPPYVFDWKIELLEAVVHPAAANGQLLGAHIRVRGLLQLVRWRRSGGYYTLRWGKKGVKRSRAGNEVCFLPDIKPDSGEKLWALLIVHATNDTSWMKMGLLLTKKDNDKKVWVRVGTFRQYDRPGTPTDFFEDGDAKLKEIVIE